MIRCGGRRHRGAPHTEMYDGFLMTWGGAERCGPPLDWLALECVGDPPPPPSHIFLMRVCDWEWEWEQECERECAKTPTLTPKICVNPHPLSAATLLTWSVHKFLLGPHPPMTHASIYPLGLHEGACLSACPSGQQIMCFDGPGTVKCAVPCV